MIADQTALEYAQALEAHPDYRVLRRLQRRDVYNQALPGEQVYRGIYLDSETTGLDTSTAAVIELGMVPFDYSSSGQLLTVHHDHILNQFNDPGIAIPPEVVELTGITDDMVAGQRIDPVAVDVLVNSASLIVAHNAGFDRPVVERHWPIFANRNWACSVADIPWKQEGIGSAKLDYLAMQLGFFFEGHRTSNDCLAGVEILGVTLPKSGHSALRVLLDNARATTIRIRAIDAPFDAKDDLKGRGYTWHPGAPGIDKAWWKDIPEMNVADELNWLGAEVFPHRDFSQSPLPMERITAANRYKN